MKHAIGVANLEAFLFAMKKEGLPEQVRNRIASYAGETVRAWLLGEEFNGHKLSDFIEDSYRYEQFHKAYPNAEIEKHD